MEGRNGRSDRSHVGSMNETLNSHVEVIQLVLAVSDFKLLSEECDFKIACTVQYGTRVSNSFPIV